MSTKIASVLSFLIPAAAFSQAAPRAEFEVASVRASDPGGPGRVDIGVHIDGAQVRILSLTLRDYLAFAYRTKLSRIFGPDWIASERFDIAATLPEGSKADQVPEMLQALLADRFRLKLHREQKELPVYALVTGKGPLKLKQSPPDPDKADAAKPDAPVNVTGGGSGAGISVNLGGGSSWSFVPNRFEAKKLTMDRFATDLERFADRPIVNMTGLAGQFDFAFDINPEDYRPMLIRSAVAAGVQVSPGAMRLLEGSSSASLSDALGRIGLKLDARKAPLDVIVVDEALKTPTPN